ncbi:ABC transporter substrate-binding protein [Cellulosilyticum sp. I15G10I2]|uniref:ABC transporter substrate-binding protein n=1 Tax=Cellulosilyticum sp. I15G10I2 TaxID=1892843 RepID=UPI000AC360F4|nr:ABC transporter substrate-binding protein [Cellulosilyticum sp. I15G10I2]
MKKILVLVFILLLIIGAIDREIQAKTLAATNVASTTESVLVLPTVPTILPANNIYIPLIVKGLQAEFWQPVRMGAERAARDYGIEITFEGTYGEGETEAQLDILRNVLDRNPQAIVLSAVDSRAATPYLERARAAGIPVIGFDSGVDSPIVRTTVATDNYGAGALAASKMAELLDGTGKVAVIVQDDTSRVASDRRDGFVDIIEQQYPGMEVVAIKYGEGNVDLSAERAKEIIREHPDVSGIFGGNEGSAHGVIKAVKELNKEGEILIIGFDSGRILLDAIREGVVAGAVTQNPSAIGYLAVEAAIRAYRGETLPPFIDTGFIWYDSTNIVHPEIQELLYE